MDFSGLDAAALRQSFDADSPPTVGLEEEVMLLDPGSYDLLPQASRVVDASAAAFVKAEMPASQLELLTFPTQSVAEAAAQLYQHRQAAARAAHGIGVLGAAGAHPFAATTGPLAPGSRYAALGRRYGQVANRQLICALQVHVAIRPADSAVAVYNAFRSYLPDVAALAANAPFHAGSDSGLASVRPKVSELLPRQGVPPVLASVEQWADELSWGQEAGALEDPGQWWWELRLNPRHGTVEVRVPDAQTTVEEAAAVASVVHCLCVHLAQRHQAGDLPAPAPDWRIAHNRTAAYTDGLDATLADPHTGKQLPVRQRLADLLDELGTTADRLGCRPHLEVARSIADGPGAPTTHRRLASERGLTGLVRWLAERFLERPAGGTCRDSLRPGRYP